MLLCFMASSAPGADDGYMYLYIDGVLQEAITGIDNDTTNVDTVYMGAYSSIAAGTYGIIYMDDCQWLAGSIWQPTAISAVAGINTGLMGMGTTGEQASAVGATYWPPTWYMSHPITVPFRDYSIVTEERSTTISALHRDYTLTAEQEQ